MRLTVGDLKGHLEDFPDDLEILIPSDDEGNDYRFCYYTPFIGTIYIDSCEIEFKSDEELEDGWDEDDRDTKEVVIIG